MLNRSEASSFSDARGQTASKRHDNENRYAATKRAFDILVAICALVASLPFIVIGALAVKLTSPGPAFYRAKRAGRNGSPFYMLKLRTMVVDTDTAERRITEVQDTRITPVGRFLRKFKIDELPQFWNVLRGEMSVVGPRPEDWEIVKRFYTPEQMDIFRTSPGIFCSADVRWYPDLTYHDPPPAGMPVQEWYVVRHLPAQIAEGVKYADEQNLLLDMRIIWQTLFCVLIRSWLLPTQQPLTPPVSSVSGGSDQAANR